MNDLAIPQWASFFNEEEYELFCNLIEKTYGQRKGSQILFEEGIIKNAKGEGYLNLQGIALGCKQNKKEQWEDMIKTFFRKMEESQRQQEVLSKMAEQFENVKDKIILRIINPNYIPADKRNNFIFRTDIPQTSSMLFLDLPETVIALKKEYLEKWGKQSDELFELGLQNAKRISKYEEIKQDLRDGITAMVLAGEDLLIPTHALYLSEHNEFVGANGSLVIIPSSRYLVSYPIHDISAVSVVKKLFTLANNMVKNESKPTSERVYHYKNGDFEPFEITIKDQTLNITPPPSFVGMLNKLAQEKKAEPA